MPTEWNKPISYTGMLLPFVDFSVIMVWLGRWRIRDDQGPFVELLDVASFYDFDACMQGGSRDKRTSFLSSLDLSDICLDCDGNHEHAEWGVQSDGTFATAKEAEYPVLLCQNLSAMIVKYAISTGRLATEQFETMHGKVKTDATVQIQSRRRMPPIMPEFFRVFEVDDTDISFTFDSKDCLTHSVAGVAVGSKKLRVQRKQVGKEFRLIYLFGEYRTEQQFVDAALSLQHPFDQFCDVPDCVLRLIFFMLVDGPLASRSTVFRRLRNGSNGHYC